MTNLKELKKSIDRAVEDARKKRNEEDRKFIVAGIGRDLVNILKPLLVEIAKNNTLQKKAMEDILKKITIDKIDVKLPSIHIPKITVPPVYIPPIKVPTPQVTVKPADVRIPKEMEVKGLKGLIKNIADALKQKPKIEFNQDKPMQVILTDDKGRSYKALTSMLTGGGGRGVITVQKATGSKIDQLLLADVTKWYALTMPKNMVSLDMFLGLQGAKCYYRWDSEADETQPRMPIFPGYSRSMVNARFGGRKMYVTSPSANQTIVVEYFLE